MNESLQLAEEGSLVDSCEVYENSLVRPIITIIKTAISGCFELRPTMVQDTRGSFTKIFHRPLWNDLGLQTIFAEEYATYSHASTVRGLHLQLPPMAHDKVVVCLRGSAFDVAIDLRKASPTYGEHISVDLNSTKANALYLPAGVAHGFCVTGDEALLYYKQTSVYSPEHDAGIRWDSAGIAWPIDNPILSERDRQLPALKDFDSPFEF